MPYPQLCVFAFALTSLNVAPAVAQEAFPLGVWTDARHRMVVRIVPCDASGASFCGTIVQDNRRGRPTNPPGHIIIRSLAPLQTHWAGQAYDGGLRLHFTLHPNANGKVKARLCIVGVLCLNEDVQRVSALVARANYNER